MHASETIPPTPIRLLLILAALGLGAVPGSSQGLSWAKEGYLASSTHGVGHALAVDGGTAVVAGAVGAHVFARSGPLWIFEAELVPSAPMHGHNNSVAIRGDTVVFGVPSLDPLGTGAAFVFERSGTSWTEVAQLTISPGFPGDALGAGVAIAEDGEVLVGVPGKDDVSTDGGAVAVFIDDGAGAWNLQALLFASDAAAGDELGRSVSASGHTLAVGAPSPGLAGPGKAYVFTGSGAAWSESAILQAADGEDGDEFGTAVAVAARTVLVGAKRESEVAPLAGAAYVFEPGPTTWVQTAKLTGSSTGTPDQFGSSVALEGDLAIIGAPVGGSNAFAFLRRGTSWTEEGVLLAGKNGGGAFGRGVALAGSRALVGDSGADLGYGLADLRGLAFDATTGWFFGAEPDEDELVAIASVPGGHVIGPIGFDNVQALAFDPSSGVLYGADIATDQLIVIDTLTGAGTAVGPLGFDQVRGLAFDDTGTLFGTDVITDALITIDTATGIATEVGPLGFGAVQGLAYDASTYTLYGLEYYDRELITIDTATGAGNLVGATGWQLVRCLARDESSGLLHAVSEDGSPDSFLTIDPATGVATGLPLAQSGIGLAHSFRLDLLTTYCTSGTSASGCTAGISASGAASASAPSGFTLSATGVEGAKNGFFFFASNGRQANPWGSNSSYQCVAPPVYRAGMMVGTGTAGACDGAFAQDLNAFWCEACPKPAKNPGPGAVVQAQLWYRDPQNPGNQTTSLSNAIEFLVGQ